MEKEDSYGQPKLVCVLLYRKVIFMFKVLPHTSVQAEFTGDRINECSGYG